MLSDRIARIYRDAHADALFVECDFLRRYLTGFYSTDGIAVVTENRCVLFADLRYFEAAERALKGSGIEVIEGGPREAMELAARYHTLGVPYPHTSIAQLNAYRRAGHEVTDCMPAFERAMIVKSPGEIALIARACDIAEHAFAALLSRIKEGMAEYEVAALLEYEMRRRGAGGTSFDTIVAFGENGSVPHHETGSRKLAFGDPVLIDFGCKYEGYCSDCTRTFLFGDDKKHEDFKEAYGHVLQAHRLVLEELRSGMTEREADGIARGYLKEHGLDKYFTHSLGHGVGLLIHEAPALSPRRENILEDGMVFSDEPGVYMAGKLGIRIEDTVRLEAGRAVSFMKGKKDLIIL